MGRSRRERDRGGLVAFAMDEQRSVASVDVEVVDVGHLNRVGQDISVGVQHKRRRAGGLRADRRHLVLAVEDADIVSKEVENAGAIFMGHYTPIAVGEYMAGPNHVLRNITAKFPRNQNVGILGLNGAGKSTTISGSQLRPSILSSR